MRMKLLYTLIVLTGIPFCLWAQLDTWAGGIYVGSSHYMGDMVSSSTPNLSQTGIAVGVAGQIYITEQIGMRTNLTYGQLKGRDADYSDLEGRNFTFKTNYVELSSLVEWEPFGGKRYFSDADGNKFMDKLVSPYLYAGVGLSFLNLNTDYSGYEGESLLPGIMADRNAGSTKTSFILPVGLGLKIDLDSKFTIAVDGGVRFAFSDYLDGVSESGNPDANDAYILVGAMLYYRFTQ